MRELISIVVGILAFIFGFWLDSRFIAYVLSVIPIGGITPWLGVIKVILWILTFGITFSLSILLAYFIGGLLYVVTSK